MSDIDRSFLGSGRCPISIVRRVGMDWKLPDNSSKMAVVDPHDLHFIGLSFWLREDSRLMTSVMLLSVFFVLKMFVQLWHLKVEKYWSLHKSSERRKFMRIDSEP